MPKIQIKNKDKPEIEIHCAKYNDRKNLPIENFQSNRKY